MGVWARRENGNYRMPTYRLKIFELFSGVTKKEKNQSLLKKIVFFIFHCYYIAAYICGGGITAPASLVPTIFLQRCLLGQFWSPIISSLFFHFLVNQPMALWRSRRFRSLVVAGLMLILSSPLPPSVDSSLKLLDDHLGLSRNSQFTEDSNFSKFSCAVTLSCYFIR